MEYIIRRLLENKLRYSEDYGRRLDEEYGWIGGAPWDDDKFHDNAERLGLEVKQEDIGVNGKSLEFDYVILKDTTVFLHATTPDRLDSIMSQGLKVQTQAGGKYVPGVFLSGLGVSDVLSKWRGDKTVILKVFVDRGTKVYQDRQSNAVFVRENIPSKNIVHEKPVDQEGN